MKTIANLLTSVVLAGWIAAIAILSVQNATLISLKFFTYQSIQIPLGVMLGFCAAIGLLAGAIAPIIWRLFGFSSNNYNSEE